MINMATKEDVAYYFSRKAREWQSSEKSVENYIKQEGKTGLTQEFRSDPEFMVVCQFIQQAGAFQLRNSIGKGFEEAAGIMFGIPLLGAMDIIIGAIEEACGNYVVGEKLLKAGTAVVGVFIIGAILGGLSK